MKKEKKPVLLVLLGSKSGTELLMRCSHALSDALKASCRLIRYGGGEATNPSPRMICRYAPGLKDALHAVRKEAASGDVKMVLSDWPGENEDIKKILELLRHANIPAMLVRSGKSETEADNALVLSGGGPHIIHHFWAAQEITRELGLRARVLSVCAAESGPRDSTLEKYCSGTDAARVVGMNAPVQICRCRDVLQGVKEYVQKNDTILLGGPNYTRVGNMFSGSIPDMLSREIGNDMIMILGSKPPDFDLNDVFWDNLICMDMEPSGRDDAIRRLVDNLIEKKQLPGELRAYVVNTALKRERVCPTVTGDGLAFPHATIPGLSGMIGSLGICPQGMVYGGDPNRLTRFIFLLITPREHYDDYLGVLSDIAGLMINPDRRNAILQSSTPGEVLDKLKQYHPRS